ncbi:hypothetical protein, partial [Streptomyces sp. DSM 41534]
LQYWATITMPAAFEKAAGEWQAGEQAKATKTISSAVSSVLWAGLSMANILSVPWYMAEHAATLVQSLLGVQTMTTLVSTPLNMFSLSINSFGASAQAVQDAMETGDTAAALNAIANAPADLVDAVLNGKGGLIDYRFKFFASGGAVTQLGLNLPERLA